MQTSSVDEVTDAVLSASRVLVSIAASSLAGTADELTLPQYRTLVVLHSQGPQTLQELAAELDVAPSTATRMCDRLVRKGLLERQTAPESRREVRLSASGAGRAVVAAVSRRRRAQIRRIVAAMEPERREALVPVLADFARAAGELPESHWFLGWR
jgi:DNA-binding MarR family transcriptional regulator